MCGLVVSSVLLLSFFFLSFSAHRHFHILMFFSLSLFSFLGCCSGNPCAVPIALLDLSACVLICEENANLVSGNSQIN